MRDLFRKLLQKLFHIEKPKALPMRFFDEDPDAYCWEDWKRDSKQKYPIRYFMSETVPHFFAVYFFMQIENCWYWVVSNTTRRYHMLDLRQPANKLGDEDYYRWGWVDECNQMLYACFNILTNYVESRNSSPYHYHISEEGIEKLKKEVEEAREDEKVMFKSQLEHSEEAFALYNYWTKDRKVQAKKVGEALMDWHQNKAKDKDQSRWNKLKTLEREFDEATLDATIRLMKIRAGLWT